MKRLVIYFHYDRQGMVDIPCRLAVQAMLLHGQVLFVTNGSLAPQDRSWVQESGASLLERENTGFDVGAYRQALLTLGRDVVVGYEEVVLMNYTLAGPVCDLKPMFAAMEARKDLDFWGLTRHYAMRSRRFGGNVPEHLQSHFLAVRTGLLQSEHFWRYWQEMPLPGSYEESIIRHETRFTPFFSSLGFTWDSYVNSQDLAPVFVNPIMGCPRELVANRGCPFFKRRSLFTPYADELRRTDGNAARQLLTYIRENTEFPVDALIRSLLRDQPMSAMAQNLHWLYLLPTEKESVCDLDAMGLQLVRWDCFKSDPVTDWYLQESVQMAEQLLPSAAALFRTEPLLGVLTPAVPLWPQARRIMREQWCADRVWAEKQMQIPVNDEPPPISCAGWALVRTAAFTQGVPDIQAPRDLWRLPLMAQKQGYFSAVFEDENQTAARADIMSLYMQAADEPAALAKQLGRLAKRRLKRR